MKNKKKNPKTPREKARDERNPVGRPTVFTQEILDIIIQCIAVEGLSERATFNKLETINKEISWTAWYYFKCWCRHNDAEFMNRLAQAKEDRCEVLENRRHEIANDESRDIHQWEEITEGPKGTTVKRGATSDNTAVQRDKLRIEDINETLRTTMPRKYGQKVENTLQGPGGSGLNVVVNITRKTKDGKDG